MPLAAIDFSRPVEYSILHHVRATGPTMGYYSDHPIAASIVDEHGRRFVYAGIAPRRWNGQYDVDALKTGEFIVEPGLVYRYERSS
jgi:hypothetical protein